VSAVASATAPERRSSAILLVNTGTPAEPRSGAVRRYLARFLSDRRVVELPRLLWLPLLYGLVLPLRAPRSAHRYRLIWKSEGSPLRVHSAEIRSALERALGGPADAGSEPSDAAPARVDLAFLYSEPLLDRVLDILREARTERLLVLPLFPQSSGTSTGAVYDQVGAALRRWRAPPDLRIVADYHAEPAYIDALAASVREHWQQPDDSSHLLISFHGIPQACVRAGDAYEKQCRRTASLLAAALQLPAARWSVSFQSRFGAARWLEPATAGLLQELPRNGIRAVTVICPGFVADCLETLEEIALEGRALFLKAGGERFDYVPALNARADHIQALNALLRRNMSDWLPSAGS
jgi:protoporphyrin/coproporphyrin ferrochelatase